MLINILIIILIIIIIYNIIYNIFFKTIEGLDKNSNIFDQVLNNANGVQQKLLGPNYPYYKYIRTPKEIGMSDKGTMDALTSDINGLINYTKLLVQGSGKASATGKPLGNKFFLNTGAKCNDIVNKKQVDRYIYVNNVPEGNIPFISQGLGVNFSEFKGLIPGSISNLNVLNPYNLLQSFLSGSVPDCKKLTMETIDVKNNKSSETHYVTLIDIKNMDPCIFPNKINPITKNRCRETFENNKINNTFKEDVSLPEDLLTQIYYASLAGMAVFIFYKIMEKSYK
jgi:hypothetical protein